MSGLQRTGEGLLRDMGRGKGERRLGPGVQRDRTTALAARVPSRDDTMPVLREGIYSFGKKKLRGLPYNLDMRRSSMMSRRRSPDSIFETKDCGFRSLLATSTWVSLAATRASRSFLTMSRCSAVKIVFDFMPIP